MPKVFNLKSFLIGKLRRLSYQIPARSEVKKRARIARGLYRCEACKTVLRNGEYQLDHIIPIINPTRGFVSWDDYIGKLFVGADGLQLLCIPCHKTKTNKENERRLNERKQKVRKK